MIDLSMIDLISINCVNPEESVKALLYSSEKIKFGSIKLFSHIKPSNLPDHFEFIQTEKFTHETINWFALNKLPRYIKNDYMLSIQDDGFILNPDNWTNEFLKYDYIGAPWPDLHWCKKNRVGNGGFVLYSKKFLNYCLGIKQTMMILYVEILKKFLSKNGRKKDIPAKGGLPVGCIAKLNTAPGVGLKHSAMKLHQFGLIQILCLSLSI